MTLAIVFPGQGSQSPGMGRALHDAFASARAVFEEVDAALGQDLTQLMFDGPADELTLTENAQPALMTVSLAVIRALEAEFGVSVARADYLAGHSLGEYSALAAGGALGLADAARLLKLRGRAMQDAAPVGEGAMAALLGADIDQATAACVAGREHGVCEIANDNAPGQIVISGAKAAVAAAAEAARAAGVKKAMMLDVSAPFHCALMEPAARAMEAALGEVNIEAPSVPVVANVTARPETEPENIRRQLVEQVTASVRWRESVAWMAEQGVDRMAEAGAGKVLTQMLKRAAPDVKGVALNTPEDLEAFAASLQEA